MSWLSSAIGGIGKLVKPAITIAAGAATGGIGGAIVAGAGSLLGGGGGAPKPASIPQIFTGSRPGLDFGDVGDLIRRVAPGGSTGRGRVAADSGGHCPRGYHPAKDGRGCVRNRRMNYANGRAIARSVRRVRGAEKMFRKVFTINHKQAPGKIMPKRRGRGK